MLVAAMAAFVARIVVSLPLKPWLHPQPVIQPIPFNHFKHRAMVCVMCHNGADKRSHAGLPDMDICLSCHATPPPNAALNKAVWEQASKDHHIQWIKLTREPRSVFFSHREHATLGGIECVTCHDGMPTTVKPPEKVKVIHMQDCLDCHIQNNVSTDCARCHK
jgi:hypothetical protein